MGLVEEWKELVRQIQELAFVPFEVLNGKTIGELTIMLERLK